MITEEKNPDVIKLRQRYKNKTGNNFYLELKTNFITDGDIITIFNFDYVKRLELLVIERESEMEKNIFQEYKRLEKIKTGLQIAIKTHCV